MTVDVISVPPGVGPQARCASDGARFPFRRRFGDALLDSRAPRELGDLVEDFGELAGPGAIRDGYGQEEKVDE